MTARSVKGGEGSILEKIRYEEDFLPPPEFLDMCKEFLKKNEEDPDCEWIDYHDFGKKWLPLFNYNSHKDLSQIPIFHWVQEVAKSPYRPVKLMRYVDGEYKQIALIPPIFDNEAEIIKSPDRDYYGQLAAFESAKMVHVNRKGEANSYLERNFGQRIKDPKYQLNKHIIAMNKIFELYGFKRELPDWLTANEPNEVRDIEQPKPKQICNSDGLIEDDDDDY